MAGRGTDIKLGEGVVELGGLAVIGTERHESRRIDNQLRGRSGRQGDPGYSCFYLSCEDDLLVRFGSDRFKTIVRLGTSGEVDEEGNELPLSMKIMSNFIENAQKRVEGSNYDRRKNVVEYDEVLRLQREVIYQQRYDILTMDDMEPVITKMFNGVTERYVNKFVTYEGKKESIDLDRFFKEFIQLYFNAESFEDDAFDNLSVQEVKNKIFEKFVSNLQDKKNTLPKEIVQEFMKVILLKVVDRYWMNHIDEMSSLRQSIGLKSYSQENPLREYKELGFQMFNDMIMSIENDVVININRAQIRDNLEREQVAKPTGTSGGGSEETLKKKPVTSNKKPGRNEPCPCGSGKKYKNCCGK